MSAVLFRRTWAAQRVRLSFLMLALLVWGFLLPVVFATFGKEMGALARSGTFATAFDLLSRFTGGDVFSIRGTVALGLVHPIALALVTIQVVGFAAAAVAGERQRGTLEVLLARPLERRVLHLTMLAAMLLFAALTEAAVLGGIVAGALLFGVAGDLQPVDIALCWLNGVALFGALGAISLAASVSFDRVGPAGRLVLVGQFLGFIPFDHTPHLTESRKGIRLRCTSCHSQVMVGSHIAVTPSTCALCHNASTIPVYHRNVFQTTANPTTVAGWCCWPNPTYFGVHHGSPTPARPTTSICWPGCAGCGGSRVVRYQFIVYSL